MTNERHPYEVEQRTGGVTIGDVFGGIWNSIIAGGDVIVQTFTGSDERRAQRNRQIMLQRVKDFWIKGVLEQSLHGAAMIELGMEERADAVERPWDIIVQMPDRPDRQLTPGTKIIDVFDEANGALLILGEPGSGKTTMLLELARDTIARAEEDPTQPIPVVFNLSSWAEKRQRIAEWLVGELNTKYNIPKRIARPWVENDDLLLLLDGLDEVRAEHREACVKAINTFRQEHGLMPLVVCSRVADYDALITRLRLHGAVLLHPLTPQQVDRYLEDAGIELFAVHRTLQHDPTLKELARTPLMLSVMTLAYRGLSIEDLGSLDSIEACRRHVVDVYVERMFERRGVCQPYSPERTIYWMTCLARGMSQRSQALFLIEQIQPDWLQIDAQRRLYGTIVRSIFGLINGLAAGLNIGLMLGLTGGTIGGLVIGLLVGLTSQPMDLVKPAESLKWSWKESGKGLVSGLVLGLIMALIRGASSMSLILGPVIGGLLGGLILGPARVELETKTVPNQGIRNSLRNAAIIGLGCGLVGGLIYGFFYRPTYGLIFGLFMVLVFGLMGGLIFGGNTVIQHFTLRFILYRNGYIPWSLARFLDYATERIFLRKVGGGYIFIHRLLREHFAAMYEETS